MWGQNKCILKYTEQRRLQLLLYHFRAIVSDGGMAPADNSAEKASAIFRFQTGTLEFAGRK
jgi:hypothetical protein